MYIFFFYLGHTCSDVDVLGHTCSGVAVVLG